ncbi:glycosyltransferase [Liberibacter crescens]|uniref:glycosyltransferase n=1 Tax=Liberibacter crescens TaxID=1273132 RepID=UPI00155ED23D|nr:glycosyltransferase [Liberibacter crescens]
MVIRTKDRAVLLRRALESVQQSTYENWKLVIINDGGESEDVDWLVSKIFCGDTRVQVIHHPVSLGMEAASNAGIAKLDTKYAVIHDDDDSWSPEFLSSMISTIDRKIAIFPSIKGIVSFTNIVYETVSGNGIIIDKVKPFRSDMIGEGFLNVQKMLIKNQFPPIAFMFDLEEARALGLFNESLPVLGDWDFNMRFILKHDIWVLPEYLSFYHHRTSASGALSNTIYCGHKQHKLYTQKIRNDLIRKAVGEDGRFTFNMTVLSEIQELLDWSIHNRSVEQPKWRKKLSTVFRRVRNFLLRRGN